MLQATLRDLHAFVPCLPLPLLQEEAHEVTTSQEENATFLLSRVFDNVVRICVSSLPVSKLAFLVLPHRMSSPPAIPQYDVEWLGRFASLPLSSIMRLCTFYKDLMMENDILCSIRMPKEVQFGDVVPSCPCCLFHDQTNLTI